MKFTLPLIILFTLLAITPTNTSAQIPKDSIQISLLTCSSSNDLYASFGHAALRIVDHNTNQDIVFDYGVFDFQEPNFVWKFMKGDLLYWVATRDFKRFIPSYEREGREVKEDILNLTHDQELKIIHSLLENLKPENKYYKYDFINDNCATRIRDMLINEDFIFIDTLCGSTFRDNFNYYLGERKWMQLGVDLLLGQKCDKEMTSSDAMFLPFALSNNIKNIKSADASIPMVESTTILFAAKTSITKTSSKIFQPLVVLLSLFLLFLFLYFKKRNLLSKIRPFIYALLGLMSFVILFMWFASSHDATNNNWNILWLNPLYLLLIFKSKRSYQQILLKVLSLFALSACIFWPIIPQNFNIAIIPVIGILLLLNLDFMKPSKEYRFRSN